MRASLSTMISRYRALTQPVCATARRQLSIQGVGPAIPFAGCAAAQRVRHLVHSFLPQLHAVNSPMGRAMCSTSAVDAAPIAPTPTRFAVFHIGGSQYKVSTDDLICTEKLDAPVGASIAAGRVLLVGEAGATVIGSPLIEGARVHATVEEQGYGEKVIVFKKKRRKGYRRWRGYRARLTLLRIGAIEVPDTLETELNTAAAELAARTRQ